MKPLLDSLRRIYSVFRKSLRETLRDWLTLSLSLAFAPLFIFLYYLITAGGSTTYGVVLINLDEGARLPDGRSLILGDEIPALLEGVTYADGQSILRVRQAASQAEVETMLRERSAAAFVILPPDFTRAILAMQSGERTQPVQITFGGDLTNPYYTVASVMALSAVETYVQQATGVAPLVQYTEAALGSSGVRTEFEIYTPGILVFAIIMLVFLAAMSLAREAEAGTLRRLQLTRLTSFELLTGMSGVLILVGLASEFLAFGTALLCGFHSQGPLWVAILVGALTSLSVIGTGLMVAAFSRTVSQAFVIANFPLGLFMFFSGTIYPMPRVELFSLGKLVVGLYDVLPPTHAVSALNKIFVLGAGVSEVTYELVSLSLLTVLYFAVGVWLFRRKRLM